MNKILTILSILLCISCSNKKANHDALISFVNKIQLKSLICSNKDSIFIDDINCLAVMNSGLPCQIHCEDGTCQLSFDIIDSSNSNTKNIPIVVPN